MSGIVNQNNLVFGGDMMIFVTISGATKPIAHSSSAKLTVSRDIIKFSSKDTGNYNGKRPSIMDWSVSTDALVVWNATGTTYGTDALWNLYQAGSLVSITFGVKTGSTPNWTLNSSIKYLSGQAYIASMDFSADNTSMATVAINLDGNGALTLT
jgi:predicted secreted protein